MLSGRLVRHPLRVVGVVEGGVARPMSPLTITPHDPLGQVQPAELVLAHAAPHVVAPACEFYGVEAACKRKRIRKSVGECDG